MAKSQLPLPYKEKEIEKLYYSIGEVAELLQVSASLIRYWQKEFDVLKPKKNRKGNRLFTPDDINQLKLIYHLVKEKGFTLEGAKNKLKGSTKETERDIEIIERLEKVKNFLEILKDEL